MLTTKECQEIQERCNRTADGPWKAERYGGEHGNDLTIVDNNGFTIAVIVPRSIAAFITTSRTDIPALLDTVEKLRKLLDMAKFYGSIKTGELAEHIDKALE